MENFIKNMKERARNNPAKVVFPEGNEPRILEAVKIILEENTACPILLGNPEEIQKIASELNVNLKDTPIIDPTNSDYLDRYTELTVALRAHKGMTPEKARKALKDNYYFALIMLYHEEADAVLGGLSVPTPHFIKPALQIIEPKEEFHKVSSFFIMISEDNLLLFADAAVNINPTSEELAEIAIDTAETAKRFGIDPKVAMLSFSTQGSTTSEDTQKVKKATEIAQKKRPDLIIEGEMQVDTAIVPEVAKIKFPDSKIKGNANVLIFPNLDAGNIGYKLVERLGKYKAIGPILQGLSMPVNDLSRGCKVDDIVALAAISSIEAANIHYPWEN